MKERTRFSERFGRSVFRGIPDPTIEMNGRPLATYEQLIGRYGRGSGVITITVEDAVAWEALRRPYGSISEILAAHERNVEASGRGELTMWGRPARIRPLYAKRTPRHPKPLGAYTAAFTLGENR